MEEFDIDISELISKVPEKKEHKDHITYHGETFDLWEVEVNGQIVEVARPKDYWKVNRNG